MTLSSPQIVMDRLDAIERDLDNRQNEYEEAAGDTYRLRRDYALEEAKAFAAATGSPTERKQGAVAVVGKSPIFEALREAEGIYEAHKAAINILTTRSIIGMALLKAQGRA